MKKTITVLTATRAEYGLLKPIVEAIRECDEFCVKIVVTGAHLSPEFGLTYKEIEKDGFQIDRKIEILLSSDSPVSISKSMGLALISFSEYFEENRPDALAVLGDRYETLAVCIAAMNARVPILHFYGGETTEGAVDEAIRHSITKMSYLHFTSTEQYRKRVIQLGESPDRVFAVGGIGVENALSLPILSKEELEENLCFSLDSPYAIVTFHPVTLEDGEAEKQCRELLNALDMHKELRYIFTMANADAEGRIINIMIKEYVSSHSNAIVFDSLGTLRYMSALKYAAMVIGNSSSGLLEVPSFHIPTINIGDRQKGRLQAESVITCEPVCEEISKAIDKARSYDFLKLAASARNPYGDGNTSKRIAGILRKAFMKDDFNLKKKFFDVGFEL